MDDINFEDYPWVIGVHEEILSELDKCKAKRNGIRASIGKDEEESRGKYVYMQGCTLILHYFALEHILAPEIDLISVVTPRMLKCDAMPLYKTLRAAQKEFGASKEVIGELRPMTDEHHHLIGLKDEETKTLEKQSKA